MDTGDFIDHAILAALPVAYKLTLRLPIADAFDGEVSIMERTLRGLVELTLGVRKAMYAT